MEITLTSFLTWLVTGGAVIAVSWICEQMAWFQALSPNSKRWVQFGASAVLGCAALAINQYVPEEILETLAPYFAIVAAAFVGIFLNQLAHVINPSRLQ